MAGKAVMKADMVDEEVRFTKEQLIGSVRYREQRDVLGALLEQGVGYTMKEADGLISQYMKGKVV